MTEHTKVKEKKKKNWTVYLLEVQKLTKAIKRKNHRITVLKNRIEWLEKELYGEVKND